MNSELLIVDAGQPAEVMAALRSAMYESGPPVLIRDPRASKLLTESTAAIEGLPKGTALVIQTSGTSGKPKTVALSRQALIVAAESSHRRLGGAGQWLLAVPLTFIAGASVLTRSIVADSEPIVMKPGPFDASTFIAAIEEMTGKRKYSALVPVQLARVLEHATQNSAALKTLRQLDAILIGGQSIPGELSAQAAELGVLIVRTYGSSETAGGCVYDGIPLDDVTVEIDPDTQEIFISAPQLATQYVGDEQRTREVFQKRNGKVFFATGDLGRIDGGVLSVIGRNDRTIITGGLKVNLDEVERAITPEISQSELVAIHIPNLEWGSAVAVLVESSATDTEQLRRRISEVVTEKLGRAATPAVIAFTTELPRITSGKPDLIAAREIVLAQS